MGRFPGTVVEALEAVVEGGSLMGSLVGSRDGFLVVGAWMVERFDHDECAVDGYLRISMSLESKYRLGCVDLF